MSKIPALGLHIIGLLVLLLLASLGLWGAGKMRISGQGMFTPPESINDWKRTAAAPLVSDRERDNPTETATSYLNGDQPPINVHIARVESFNAFRSPTRYLVDRDGHVRFGLNVPLPEHGKMAYNELVIDGITTNVLTFHWIQAPGGRPYPYISEKTSAITQAVMLNKPYYVCDVWTTVRPNTDGIKMGDLMLKFVSTISAKIQANN